MSDRFPAQMMVGGDLTEQSLAELIQAVETEGAKVEVEAQADVEQPSARP